MSMPIRERPWSAVGHPPTHRPRSTSCAC